MIKELKTFIEIDPKRWPAISANRTNKHNMIK
jgi:hypothetical protein